MHIAIFTEIYFPYIHEIASRVFLLRNGLISLGHEVLIITSDLKMQSPHLKQGILRCPAKQTKNQFGFEINSSCESDIAEVLSEFSPDVFHLHTDSLISQIAIKLASRLDLPIISTFHSFYEDWMQYDSGMLHTIRKLRQKNKFRDYMDNADIITCPTHGVKTILKKFRPQPEIFVISNPTETPWLRHKNLAREEIEELKEQFHLPQNKTLALFIGCLGVENSIEALLELWAKTIKKNDNLHLVIVGDGPERNALLKWSKKLSLSDQVTFVPQARPEDLFRFNSICDIFVTSCCSDFASPFLFDAIACGLPAIVRFHENGSDWIKEGVNGFFYRNEEEFKKRLKLFSHITERERYLLKKVTKNSLQEISALPTVKTMIELYQKAIDRHYYKEK